MKRRRNNRTNAGIMWLVIGIDFVLLNVLLYLFCRFSMWTSSWNLEQLQMYILINNLALIISEFKFHTTIHKQIVTAGEIARNITYLSAAQAVVAYVIMRHIIFWKAVGWLTIELGLSMLILLSLLRLLERRHIKAIRRTGRNSRTITLVGNDSELRKVCGYLKEDPTTGYRIKGYYADEELDDARVDYLGTVKGLMEDLQNGKEVDFGDELYVCLSKRERPTIKALSEECDKQVTKFFFIPISVDALGLNLKREYIHEMEIFTTHLSPLEFRSNRALKRIMDIVIAIIALAFIGLMFPFIWVITKIQSPGPVLFRQSRTGLDGKDFVCYKFRSMHVNKDSDTRQATNDDPRRFPFGTFMRKYNIDELPQFWNVLKGDMSVVGPRPHMLYHTGYYKTKINNYMVRHFVLPGITGYAQVTGFRGETRELWQMEERVRRDIWYIEHWSIWLDIRIIWMTLKCSSSC